MKRTDSAPMRISSRLSNKLSVMSLVCAMMVVLIHCYVGSETGSLFWWFTEIAGGGAFGSGGLVRMAVPYFFVAAGFLMAGHIKDKSWWRVEVRKRFWSLLVPFLFWGAVFGLLLLGYAVVCHTSGGMGSRELALRAFGLHLDSLPLLIPTWFLRCLFLLVVASPIFIRLANPLGLFALFLLYAGHTVIPSKMGFFGGTFWDVTLSTEGMFYFTLGIFLRSNPINISHKKFVLVLSGMTAFLCLLGYASLDCNDVSGILAVARSAFKFAAIPFSLLFVWLAVPSITVPHWLRSSPFPIFLLHYMILFPATRLLHLSELPCYLNLIISFVIGLGGSVLVEHAIRKVLPSVARIVFGGR